MVKKTHRLRVLLVAFLSLLVFLAIEARLYYVQVLRHDYYVARARGQQYLTAKLLPRRGDILDREQQTLATSTTYNAIYFNPPAKPEGGGDEVPAWRSRLTPEFVADLARVLDLTETRVQKTLGKPYYNRLIDMVPPETAQTVRLLLEEHGIAREWFVVEEQSKRLYPKDELLAPLIGLAGVDAFGQNVGLEGVEFQYDTTLNGELTTQTLQVTNRHGELEPLDDQVLRRSYGDTIVLTIDSEIQRVAREALQRQITRTEAQSGVVIVMDVPTGELLALVSLPDFNPNELNSSSIGNMRNRALTDPIEIGSVMKILTTAILLDNNLITVDEMIDCKNGYGVVDGRVFKDSHAQGVVPFSMAFAESSNIAMATVGLRLEPTLYYDSLRRFGLGSPLGIDLPGEGSGVLRPVSQWSRLSRTSLPVGYETSLTALQVVSAVAAIGNKGVRMHPHVVKRVLSFEGRVLEEIQPRPVARVTGEETAKTMMDLMRLVVDKGTGAKARVPGYTVAGKTGTTRKHSEERRYIASFAGLIPAIEPRLAIYCYVNEPNRKIDFYGGSIAAPVFAEVGAEAVRIMGIPPDAPEPRLIADAPDGSHGAVEVADAGRPASEALEGFGAFEAEPGEGVTDGAELAAWSKPPGTSVAEVVPLKAVDEGGMPNCLGLTMSEVIELAAESDLPIKMVGSGLAIQQTPPPGTPMIPGRQVLVVFAAPSQQLPEARLSDVEPAAAAEL